MNTQVKEQSEPPVAQARKGSRLPDFQFSRFSGLYIWALMILIFGIAIPDTFLTTATAKELASAQSIVAVLAIGALVPLACGCFDISVGQMLGTSAIMGGWLMANQDVSPMVAILATLGFGVLIGSINGILVAWVGVDSLIATLGMGSILLALSGALTKYQFIGPFPQSFGDLVSGDLFGIPIVTVYMLVIAIFAWYALEHTPLGRRLYATGASRDAARLAGVRTGRYIFSCFVVSATLASVAGLLLAAKINQVSPTVGPEYLLPAYAACFLGTTQVKPGTFNVLGTLLALFLLGTGVIGLQLVGGELWITNLFNGTALIIAVSAAVLSSKWKARRQRLAAAEG